MLDFITYVSWINPSDHIHLLVANFLLGVVVFVLLSYVIVMIVLGFRRQKKEHREEVKETPDLKEVLSKLGLTMRDGGKPLKDDDKGSTMK